MAILTFNPNNAIIRLPLLCILLITAFIACASAVSVASTGEYDIKAAFLYNFIKFVEWPPKAFANDNSPIVVAILGDDPFGKTLDKIVSDKTVEGRKIVIKRYKKLSELENCHVLFVCISEKRQIEKILEKVKDWNSLTVGDMEKFTQYGGIINFTVDSNRVGFEINLEAGSQSRPQNQFKASKIGQNRTSLM